MKRILFTIFAMSAAGVLLQAQVTKLPEGFTSSKTVWMVHLGAGFNGASTDGLESQLLFQIAQADPYGYYQIENKRKFGMNFSVAFTRNFGKSPVYWGMEVGIGKRGFKQKIRVGYSDMSSTSAVTRFNEIDDTEILLAEYVQFTPINIGCRYLINDGMALDVHAGVFTSYDYWGHYTFDVHTYHLDSSNPLRNSHTTQQGYSDVQDINGYREFDTGIVGGLGFWYGHFHIECGYQYGFVSAFKGDARYHTNSWQAKLGYAF